MSNTIQLKSLDLDGNGKVDRWEAKIAKEKLDPTKVYEVLDGDQVIARGDLAELTKVLGKKPFSSSGEVKEPKAQVSKLIDDQKKEMETKLVELEKFKADDNAQEANRVRTELQQMLSYTDQLGKLTGKTTELAAIRKAATEDSNPAMLKSQKDPAPPPEKSSGILGKAKAAQAPASGGKATTSPPPNWAASVDGQQNPSLNYSAAISMEGGLLEAWDSINQNQSRGRQLMLLFLFISKLAESGDLGAMYQFMKFITYIISKDKAKQQIEMGKKIVQLQEVSRQYTNKLLNLQTDANNPNSAIDFQKTLQEVKGETDAIATSMKFMNDMIADGSTVVETLTSGTKALQEANSRVLQRLSRFA